VVKDTISAISTPPGTGAIGIIRISGERATKVGEKILRHPSGKPVQSWPERQVRLGVVVQPGEKILDEVVFFIFKAPRSYTGDDLLEIQGHGGMENLQLILETTLEAGARLAEPGEFTKRAFLNGRLDLTQAEAVIDLIYAQTELAHHTAITQLSGGLSNQLRAIENQLLSVLVSIEAALDYPEDDLPELEREKALYPIVQAKQGIEKLLKQAEAGRIVREAATVVLAGRPNVGKSSLLNILLQEDRAIVTPIPGTTRDFVTETIDFQGFPVRIVDTAGLREIDDLVEKEGVKRTWDWVKKADLIIFLIDSAVGLTAEDKEFVQEIENNLEKSRLLFVLNKTDLPANITLDDLKKKYPGKAGLNISALSGEGIEDLKGSMKQMLVGAEFSPEQPLMVTRLRHKEALEMAYHYLELVEEGLKSGVSEDLVTIDLRATLDTIGEVTGRTVTADIVDTIFSQFCVGK